MEIVKGLYEKSVYIGELDDCVSVSALEGETVFMEAEQVSELIEELERQLERLNLRSEG